MLTEEMQKTVEPADASRLEFYRLIGEGYKAVQDGRTSTVEEVRKRLGRRRGERGQRSFY